jgi:glycosyltransferase involved in cell wall biosynthesis
MQFSHSRGNPIWQPNSRRSDPPIPEWIDELWVRHGKPRTKGTQQSDEGQALLWFVSQWIPIRAPYRFDLPQELVAWLNATEIDLTGTVKYRPALSGPLYCDALKPVSRFMYAVAEQYGSQTFDHFETYYDFLAWYSFSFIPERNVPGVLLPAAVIDLLNAPATTDDIPLTVGMLLYLQRAYPEELKDFRAAHRERIIALSFCAVEGMLSMGHSRLIPPTVSGFWRHRPLKLVTAFEFVAANVNNSLENGAQASTAAVETELRKWFQRGVASAFRAGSLMSGPSGDYVKAGEAPEPLADSAVVIYRDHYTVCGLSKAGAIARDALLESGVPIFDLHFSLKRERLSAEREINQAWWINARRKLHLVNVNPEFVAECCLCNASRIWPGDYLVGQFYWELSRISKMHQCGIRLVDEIWTASRYLTEIYARETGKPVFTMGQAISAKEPAVPLNRKEFGFANDSYLFLSNFDGTSVVERKNPLGAIIAFQRAFPRGTERTGLVIKTRNLEHLPTDKDRMHWASALERIQKDSRIRVIDYTMSEDAMAALYHMCDCFVSLHRSEGFGFGPAEAMAYGRPAIVTNYSGVCDFCTETTAKLVPYELVRVRENEYPYLDPDRVYEWADPDLTIAAEYMRELAEDREQGRRLGCAAQELISREYSISSLQRRYLNRLQKLGFVENTRPAAVCN